jgi:hypothetical protein
MDACGMSGRVLVCAGVLMIAAIGLGAYLGVAGLSGANELAGVLSGFAALAGLGVAAYGVVQAHKDALESKSREPGSGQSVMGTTTGPVTQVRRVVGNVRMGHRSSPSPSPSAPSPAMPPAASPSGLPGPTKADSSGYQRVAHSNVSGDVTQIEWVGGDIDIDR